MSNKNKVFVVQNPRGKNLEPAKAFGELEVVLTGHETNKQAYEKLHLGLADMLPDDFLLLIGDPLFIGMAVSIAIMNFAPNGGSPKFLVWNPRKLEYRIERITDETHQSVNAATGH